MVRRNISNKGHTEYFCDECSWKGSITGVRLHYKLTHGKKIGKQNDKKPRCGTCGYWAPDLPNLTNHKKMAGHYGKGK